MIVYHVLFLLFCLIGLGGFIDTVLAADTWSNINFKDTLAPLAFIISSLALWLNLMNRELSQSNIQHENARKLRERFYNGEMRSALVKLGRAQRENEGRISLVQVFYDDSDQNVMWSARGSTAIGLATAAIRYDHYRADDEEKYNLENFIINTLSTFEEAVSLLDRGLITKNLIKSALSEDFKFAYRVVASIMARYSKDGMMNFEHIEVERLNKPFREIFGTIEDQNVTVERRHISEAEDETEHGNQGQAA